jgi:hypothetical protein
MAEIEPIPGTGGLPGEPGPVATEPVAEAATAAGEPLVAAAPDGEAPPVAGPAATPVAARPKGLVRWGVALVAVAVLVGAVSVAAAFLAAGASSSVVQGWLPNDTVAYLELRTDLPGDQRAKLGDILAKFPGFADQASLDAKIDEALDRILEQTGVNWTTDVKPWLGGEIGLAVTAAAFDVAKMTDLGSRLDGPDRGTAPDDGAVALIAVKDGAAATAWISGQLEGTQTTETYAGGEITIVSGALKSNAAFAVRDDVLVVGPEKAVKASLDTAGKSAMASSDSFAAAQKTAPTAYLGFGYVDVKAIVEASLAAAGDTADLPTACLDQVVEKIPTWGAGFGRAEDDALVMTATVATPAATSTAKNTASAAAEHLPASTVAAVEVRDLGAGLVAVLDGLKTTLACDPSTAEAIDQIEQALAAVGGAEGIIGWADDTAVAATVDGTTLGGGLAATVSDEAAASSTLDQVKALLALAGAGAGIDSREEAYGDGTLLVVTLPSDAVAFDAPVPEIAATVQRGVFVLGTIDFVKAVVDTDAEGSLASDPVYERAIALAGGDGMSDIFIDVAGLLVGVEAMLPADEKSQYETEIKPFLEPFEAFASVVEVPGATTESRAVITFTK